MEEVEAALLIKPDYAGARDLRQQLSARIKDQNCHVEEGFAVVSPGANPLTQSQGRWAQVKCPSCGAMSFITARTCSRCGSLLPEVDDVVVLE